ncbi:hypothetical protein D3C71_2043200 [compost metagenome]
MQYRASRRPNPSKKPSLVPCSPNMRGTNVRPSFATDAGTSISQNKTETFGSTALMLVVYVPIPPVGRIDASSVVTSSRSDATRSVEKPKFARCLA